MKPRDYALAIGAFSLMVTAVQSPVPAFDPVGSWKVSTVSDEGQPMSVGVTIAGKPGAYTGQANTGERTLPLTDLATTPTGMIAVFALPQGFIVVQFGRGNDGKVTGTWGSMSQTYGLTAQKEK